MLSSEDCDQTREELLGEAANTAVLSVAKVCEVTLRMYNHLERKGFLNHDWALLIAGTMGKSPKRLFCDAIQQLSGYSK